MVHHGKLCIKTPRFPIVDHAYGLTWSNIVTISTIVLQIENVVVK